MGVVPGVAQAEVAAAIRAGRAGYGPAVVCLALAVQAGGTVFGCRLGVRRAAWCRHSPIVHRKIG